MSVVPASSSEDEAEREPVEIAEYQLSLDMRELKRTRLSMHHPQAFTAYRNGEEVGSYRVELVSLRRILQVLQWDVIVVRYTYGGSERMAERIEIDSTPCNYGGWRYWFCCPGCRRRCAVLYIKHHVRCRICHGLIFESQSQHDFDRRVSQARKRRTKLGGKASLEADFPPKPKHMRWKTYFQLLGKDEREVSQLFREDTASLDFAMARRGVSLDDDPPDISDFVKN
jgi:hypothetical protein